MAKSQMFGRQRDELGLQPRRRLPGRRGYADDETFESAFTILGRGGAIGMYVEGGRTRTGHVGEEAKAGIGQARDCLRRARRAGRDPRLQPRSQLDSPGRFPKWSCATASR